MAKALKFFDALPPYFGGKRKLAKAIFKLAPPASIAPVFADVFLGGGSVALLGKALGYQVIANDIADRSALLGKALVENNRVKLTEADIHRLFTRDPREKKKAGPGFIMRNFTPEVFLTKHAEFLDDAFHVARAMEPGPKKWLTLYLLVKYIFYIRPYSKFSSPNAFNIPMEDKRIEFIKQRTYHNHIRNALEPIPNALKKLADAINAGVIDNGMENEMHQADARAFLQAVKADVAYFDPPYAGTLAYEAEYHILDQILVNKRFERQKSEFSKADGMQLMSEVFQAARHIPTWIVSMGNAQGQNDLDELLSMVGRHRHVEAWRLKYKHLPALATKEHQEKSQEYLIVGHLKKSNLRQGGVYFSKREEKGAIERVEPRTLH